MARTTEDNRHSRLKTALAEPGEGDESRELGLGTTLTRKYCERLSPWRSLIFELSCTAQKDSHPADASVFFLSLLRLRQEQLGTSLAPCLPGEVR